MEHYIYEIQPLLGSLKGTYYIGKHTVKGDPFKDGYAGSGKVLENYYRKYGKVKGVTYNKVILEFNDSVESNSIREKEIIGDCYKTDKRCINLKAGGTSGEGFIPSEETRKKMSEAHKGKTPVWAIPKSILANQKPFVVMDSSGTIIYKSDCLTSFCREHPEFNRRTACDALNGKQKTHRGLIFKYI